ncbi:MAG TPA: hypothetical protein DD387_08895 [Lachnoclostridium sp.]|nr:hypothetical protein [Lachnoclostridium sp.]
MNVQLTICLFICVVTIGAYIYGKPSVTTIALTSLMAFVVTGCLNPATALGYFGSGNVVMIAAMFVVAAGFNRTQFVQNVANGISNIANGSLTKILIGYVLLAMILSQFIQSAIIVFGIVIPLALATCEKAGISPTKVVYPIGVTTIVTCSCLPIGSGATVAAELNGYLVANNYTDFTIGLLDPMKARLPVLIVCVIYMIFISPKFSPDKPLTDIMDLAANKKNIKEPLRPLQEKCGYVIFILVALALIFSKQIGLANWEICMIGALSMVLSGVLKPAEAVQSMNMSVVLLIVGAMGMGGALSETGAGELVGSFLANAVDSFGNPYLIGFAFFILPYLLTQFMLNRSVMMIFYPIAIIACKAMGANPVGIVILVQSACLTAFVTPMSCPVAAMITGQGGYTFRSIVKQSILPAILFSVVVVVWIITMFPLY